jgi:hypothetical protein
MCQAPAGTEPTPQMDLGTVLPWQLPSAQVPALTRKSPTTPDCDYARRGSAASCSYRWIRLRGPERFAASRCVLSAARLRRADMWPAPRHRSGHVCRRLPTGSETTAGKRQMGAGFDRRSLPRPPMKQHGKQAPPGRKTPGRPSIWDSSSCLQERSQLIFDTAGRAYLGCSRPRSSGGWRGQSLSTPDKNV